jgi:hypothetical protein
MSLFEKLSSWWSERSTPHVAEDLRGPFREPPLPTSLSIDEDGWLVGDGVISMPSRRGGTSPLLAAGAPVCVVQIGRAHV